MKSTKSLCLSLALAGLFGLAGRAVGQESFGVMGPAAGGWEAPRVVPLSKVHGVVAGEKVPVLGLERLDNAALEAAARLEGGNGKARKIGVARGIALDASMGVWQTTPEGGRLWTLDIASPGAVGMRVHFVDLALPEGASLVSYNAASGQIGQPITGMGRDGTGDEYTPVLMGDVVRVELYLPPGAAVGPLPFGADNVQHLFADPAKGLTGGGARDGDGITPTEGSCHNDVACYPAWANVASGVGLYVFSTGGGTSQCTGQLIATTNNDLTPYFITAAHCVDTAAGASSVEVFWLFQRATCAGANPNQNSSPTTSGATLVATRAASDGTLLRLTGALPGGLFWVGWTASPVTNGGAAAAVHHPDGSRKRISFGTMTDQSGCTLGVQAETVRATWTTAVTEPGSSGGGFFRSDTQQLVGTLSCGPSFCGATGSNLSDGFGRFASFYPTISTFLAGGADDGLEENDTCAAARALSPVTGTALSNTGLTVKLTDEDWYKYTIPAGNTLTVTLTFTAANGTVGGQLYTTCGGSVLATATGTGGTRTLTYVNTGGAGDEVYLRVNLTGTNPSNTYDMSTLVSNIPLNNACASAAVVAAGNSYAGTTVNATNDGTSSCPTNVAARTRPDVWYRFTAPSNGQLQLDTCQAYPADTVVSIHSACPGGSGNQIGCNDDALATGPCSAQSNNYTSYATATLTAGQQVYIRVGMWGSAAGPFTLRVNFMPTGLPNDTCAGAQVVSTGSVAFNTAAALTEGTVTDAVCDYFSFNGVAKDLWYRVVATCTGELAVDTCGSSYDTKLAVYSACPTGPDTALACNDDGDPACPGSSLHARLIVACTAGSSYYIRVGGYRTSGGVEYSGAGVLNIACNHVVEPCLPDLGSQGGVAGGDGVLNNNDFIVFIDAFFAGNPSADLGQQGGVQGSDGVFDNNDFIAFIDLFFAGCP